MYLLFLFSINLGGAFIDFFDLTAQAVLVDGGGHLLQALSLPEWLVTLLAEGMGGGIQVVATFIPIITALYLFLTLLEESGYMARAAFVMDRFLRRMGISGKAFVPLIVGFGCNVPAIMAARTLNSHQERILTILMTPFMSCGARLTVYALFAAVFFPQGGQNVIFLLYLTGIAFAILTGLVLRNTLLKGTANDFIMELPLAAQHPAQYLEQAQWLHHGRREDHRPRGDLPHGDQQHGDRRQFRQPEFGKIGAQRHRPHHRASSPACLPRR